ncbi:MAG: sigma 54-interacting transcriptional regulator [Verrucomicrobiota bacterium]
MREVNIQVLQVSARGSGAGLRQKWIGRREMGDLPAATAQDRPAALVVRNEDLPVLRTQCGSHIVDCGSKHKKVPLSRILLKRKAIPILHGSYSSAGQLLRSVRTLLEHAALREDQNVYFIGAEDRVFNDLWRRASWTTPADSSLERAGDSRDAGSDASLLLMKLLPKEAETDGLADTYMGDALEVRLVRQLILKAGALKEPVLIVGEAGTGKELVARAIHEFSGGAFIHANCAAMVPDSFDVELFGAPPPDRPGARSKPGLWQMAGHGTLYFDEINALTMSQQVKIERAMAEADRDPVRVIAAASRELSSMVHAGQFHEGLYYRLRSFMIRTPALREHPQDIPKLATAFWRKITENEKALLPEPVLKRLQDGSWPGNARELKSVLHHLHGLFGTGPLTTRHLEAALQSGGHALSPAPRDALVAHRVECLQHVRRADEAVRAAKVALRPLQQRGKPRPETVAIVQEQIRRRLAELDVLCLRPLLFGDHATYAAIYELKGRLHYFWRLLQSDEKASTRFSQDDLLNQFKNATMALFEASGRLATLT